MKYLEQFLRHPRISELAPHMRNITDIDLNFAAAEEAARLCNRTHKARVICIGDGAKSITGNIFRILFPYWIVSSIDPRAETKATWVHREQATLQHILYWRGTITPALIVAVHSHAPLPDTGDATIAIPCCVKQTLPRKCITKRLRGVHGTKHRTIKIWPSIGVKHG